MGAADPLRQVSQLGVSKCFFGLWMCAASKVPFGPAVPERAIHWQVA